jgi:hypothetical protein
MPTSVIIQPDQKISLPQGIKFNKLLNNEKLSKDTLQKNQYEKYKYRSQIASPFRKDDVSLLLKWTN